MKELDDDTTRASPPHQTLVPDALLGAQPVAVDNAPDAQDAVPQKHPKSGAVPRGLSATIHAHALRDAIVQRSLLLVNRFRVIRTIDLAVHCFPERPFKASLSAAQRAVRGMVKEKLLARYRTDRQQTVYGLTQRGVRWLADRDIEASASVRRVTDMTNPEHRLWSQFIALCAEARGLTAMTEPEVMKALNKGVKDGKKTAQGLVIRTMVSGGRDRRFVLRPDAIAIEPDGITWFEIDRSSRGSDRAASLRALALSVGVKAALGPPIRRVVVFCRNERVQNRVLATLASLAAETTAHTVTEGRAQLKPLRSNVWEVWVTVEELLKDRRTRLVDTLMGHVCVQLLPAHLPKVRIGRACSVDASGWLDSGDSLPYTRSATGGTWSAPTSPLERQPSR